MRIEANKKSSPLALERPNRKYFPRWRSPIELKVKFAVERRLVHPLGREILRNLEVFLFSRDSWYSALNERGKGSGFYYGT